MREVALFILLGLTSLAVAYAGIAFVILDPCVLGWPQGLRCFMLVLGALIAPILWSAFFERWYR